MPTVIAYIRKGCTLPKKFVRELCREIVPVGMHSTAHPLLPGDIEFVWIRIGRTDQNVDLRIEIHAFSNPEREDEKKERLDWMSDALRRFIAKSRVDADSRCTVSLHFDMVGLNSGAKASKPLKFPPSMHFDAAINRLNGSKVIKLTGRVTYEAIDKHVENPEGDTPVGDGSHLG